MAQGVFQDLIYKASLHEKVGIDSAGTYAYHAGEGPDPRAMSVASKRGYDLSYIKARKIDSSDFDKFDYVLAMDNDNKEDLLSLCENSQHKNKIKLFLQFANPSTVKEVPDPYYGGANGFEIVLDLVEEASQGLLRYLKARHALKP